MLSREQILSGVAAPLVKEVMVPEWGGSVFVRVMNAAERDKFEVATNASRVNFRARLAVAVVCDEKGQKLFTEADMLALGQQPGTALDRILLAATELNQFTAADIEKLEKNSEPAPQDD
jgi:hypothetical protein